MKCFHNCTEEEKTETVNTRPQKRVMRSRLEDRVALCSLANWCFSSFQLGIIGSSHNISSPWLCRRVNSAWWKGQWLGWGGGGVGVLVLRKVMACAKTCGVWGSALLNQGIFHTHHFFSPTLCGAENISFHSAEEAQQLMLLVAWTVRGQTG